MGRIFIRRRRWIGRVVDEVAVCLPASASRYLEPITGLAAGNVAVNGPIVKFGVNPGISIRYGN